MSFLNIVIKVRDLKKREAQSKLPAHHRLTLVLRWGKAQLGKDRLCWRERRRLPRAEVCLRPGRQSLWCPKEGGHPTGGDGTEGSNGE